MHGDGQRRVIEPSQNAMDVGTTNEQQALLIPDMVVKKQAWNGKGCGKVVFASNGLRKVRNGLYFVWG